MTPYRDILSVPLPTIRRPQPLLTPAPTPRVGLSQFARVNGFGIIAPRGHGKSRLLGRSICYPDALHHVPTVVFDVMGGTIDNALDKLLYLDRPEQLEVGDRLRYCNMSGETVGSDTYISGWPMLTRRFPNERLFLTSQRPVELIRKTDWALARASVQGLNRLAPLLTSIAIVLAALGEPISQAYEVLDNSEKWRQRLTNLAFAEPDTAEACLFLLAFFDLPPRTREERSEVLRNKLLYLRFDPVTRAMFSAKEPMIDWEEVVAKGLQVYLDFRGREPDALKELKIMWVWSSLLEYIKSRGSSGHEYPPLSVVVDELSYFVRGTMLHREVIAEEFRELVEVRSRNANVYLTVATQDLRQLPEEMQRAVLSLGNQLYGTVKDYDTALFLAKNWYSKDPKLVKDWHYIYAIESYQGRFIQAIPIDANAVYYTLEEQDYMNSRNFTDLKKGEWLFAATEAEGEQAEALIRVSTKGLDPGEYEAQNKALIQRLRSYLMQRDGILLPERVPALLPAAPSDPGEQIAPHPSSDGQQQQQLPPADDTAAKQEDGFSAWNRWQPKKPDEDSF